MPRRKTSSMPSTSTMVAGISAVVAMTMWLRRRKDANSEESLVETATSMLSALPSASTSFPSEKQAAYEPPKTDGMNDIMAACRRIELALKAAEDEGNADRAMQLRRALRRLYAALEVMEDGRDAGEEEITALTKPRRRRSRRHHQPSGLPATETPVSAAYATAHGGDSAQHGRSLAAPPREDDAISVTSDIFYDICESAEESEVCGSEAEATQGDNSLADTPHLSVATSDASQALPRTPSSRINLYKEGMELAASNDIAFRKDRTAETSCRNQQDFMARLYCVRVSTQALLVNPARRKWISDLGRTMISRILVQAEVDPEPFQRAWDELTNFLEGHARRGDGKVILEELTARGCVHISLFDAVIDYVLLDAFDDMKRLPPSVSSVLQNTWIPRAIKEKTLATAMWSVIRTRQGMADQGGLMVRFYDVMQHVSPVLACGLLGCHSVETLQDKLLAFKKLCLEKTEELFNFDETKCNTITDLMTHADSILESSLERSEAIMNA